MSGRVISKANPAKLGAKVNGFNNFMGRALGKVSAPRAPTRAPVSRSQALARVRPSPSLRAYRPHVPRYGLTRTQFLRDVKHQAHLFDARRRLLKKRATTIQRFHRGNLGRARVQGILQARALANHRLAVNAATKIQAAWRGKVAHHGYTRRGYILNAPFMQTTARTLQRRFRERRAVRAQPTWNTNSAMVPYRPMYQRPMWEQQQFARLEGIRLNKILNSGWRPPQYRRNWFPVNSSGVPGPRPSRPSRPPRPYRPSRPSPFSRPSQPNRPSSFVRPNRPSPFGQPYGRPPSGAAPTTYSGSLGGRWNPSYRRYAAYGAGTVAGGAAAGGAYAAGAGDLAQHASENPDLWSNLQADAQQWGYDQLQRQYQNWREGRYDRPQPQSESQKKKEDKKKEEKRRDDAARVIQRAYRAYRGRKRRNVVFDFNDYERKRRRY